MQKQAELSLCRPDPHSLALVVGVLFGPQLGSLKAAPCVPDHIENQEDWGVIGTGRGGRGKERWEEGGKQDETC